ncbi:MAG TPA: sodium ion-translocating decarboxylase subunit beta [Selenomonadales bacterium]|nr:sodium ion-translocating decarboxylase subunit beta [Selenomonadales bacterium]
MIEQFFGLLLALVEQTGLMSITAGNVLMIVVGGLLIYLALVKKYEPFLLLGIGFSCIVSNVPGSDLTAPGGLFYYAFRGVELVIIPPLIFLGVGAMTDFGPMISRPSLMVLGAGAHAGIFIAIILAKMCPYIFADPSLHFTINEAGAIGIIGGADGPMAIFVTMKLAPHLLPQIAVAAYSYMALMPLIQPPVMKLLTSKAERSIMMDQVRPVSRLEKIVFPFVIAIIVNLLLPPVAPLITMLMLGNMLREVLLVERLANTAANDLMNVITIILTVAVGSTMAADRFLTMKTLVIIALGLIAFLGGTASGVITAKIMNLFLKNKINPLLGAAGIASVPIAARVAHVVAIKENPYNFLIMHAMGPNLAGVFGTAISGGIMLALLGIR